MLTYPGLWKIPNKQETAKAKKGLAALKRSYDAVKRLGYKGSYNSFVLKIGAAQNQLSHFQVSVLE